MNLILRTAQAADYSATETVTREAFWNRYCPGCCEHYLLHIMRNCPAFIPELDSVAVDDTGKIVASIVFAKGAIEADNGKKYEVLTLGPIAVLPKFQYRGIGTRLIEYSKERARQMGFCAILLCGDPAYYARRGFTAAESFGIRTADNMYAAALQAYELFENALAEARGRYIEDKIYEVINAEVVEFDKRFPAKERISGTVSQKRFLEIAARRKAAG